MFALMMVLKLQGWGQKITYPNLLNVILTLIAKIHKLTL